MTTTKVYLNLSFLSVCSSVCLYVSVCLSVRPFLAFQLSTSDGLCDCSHEAMSDLIALMGSLVDIKGHILVPDIYDSVKPLTDEETSSYDSIDFDMASVSL